MNYSADRKNCRIDTFTDDGRHQATYEIAFIESDWMTMTEGEAVFNALKRRLGDTLRGMKGWWAVCLEPFHRELSPVIIRIPDYDNPTFFRGRND